MAVAVRGDAQYNLLRYIRVGREWGCRVVCRFPNDGGHDEGSRSSSSKGERGGAVTAGPDRQRHILTHSHTHQGTFKTTREGGNGGENKARREFHSLNTKEEKRSAKRGMGRRCGGFGLIICSHLLACPLRRSLHHAVIVDVCMHTSQCFSFQDIPPPFNPSSRAAVHTDPSPPTPAPLPLPRPP